MNHPEIMHAAKNRRTDMILKSEHAVERPSYSFHCYPGDRGGSGKKKILTEFINAMKFTSLLFFWAPLAVATNETFTPCKICVGEASLFELKGIKILAFPPGSSLKNHTTIRMGDEAKLFKIMDKSKPLAMVVPGWLSSFNQPSTQAIPKACLARKNYNVLVVDWSHISTREYTFAYRSVKGIAWVLATVLDRLVKFGLSLIGSNMIGHSLGAQILGCAARLMKNRLPRITGLDPAGPGFYGGTKHLTSNDAEFVVIIHSDMFVFGIALKTGHVDFYPNGGKSVQPGCPMLPFFWNVCGHYRSIYLLAHSVMHEDAFIGERCGPHSEPEDASGCSETGVVMGFKTPTTACGSYCLRTDARRLYGQGEHYSTFQELGPARDSLLTGSLIEDALKFLRN